MDNFRYIGISIISVILPAMVTGIDFTFSKQRILLSSEGTLTMTCDITELDVGSVYLFQIRKLKSTTLSGSDPNDWTTLAFIEPGTTNSPSLDPGVTSNTKDYVAGGSWDSNSPSDAVLTLSMNIQKLVCDDARYYRCELSYKSSTSGSVIPVEKNNTFTAYVKPQVTSLITRKNGFIVQGLSPTDVAAVKVGDELELTCTANIGSSPATLIRWHKTSETTSTNEFIGYQPPQGTFDDGTATNDNQCGYTRIAIIKYNTTAADANRQNNLAFECYVTVSGDPYGNSYTSENNQRFYADVTGPNDGSSDADTATAANQESGDKTGTESNNKNNHGAIIGGVVGGILAVILIVAAVLFLWLRRLGDGTNGPEKEVQHQRRESRETGLSDMANTPNIYQDLQNRTDTESTMAYDSLNGPEKQAQQQRIESRDAGASDLTNTPNDYEQLQDKTDKKISMTYDSLHAGSSEEGQSR